MASQTHSDASAVARRTTSPAALQAAALLIVPLLVATGSFAWGWAKVGTIRPGLAAEIVVSSEAERMLAGEHSYGIVQYTHYPNGPTYLFAATRELGLEGTSMRLVPLAMAGFSIGFLLWAMFAAPTTNALRGFAAVACVSLVLQPGIADWQGALHEHSYAMSLAFLALGAACVLPSRHAWVFCLLGFVAGWIGYDFIPVQGGAVVTGRWLFHARQRAKGEPLLPAFWLASLDALRFVSGVVAAVLSHILQLGLYFGGLEEALRDLLGSAAGRMGAESVEAINPEYHAFLEKNSRVGLDASRVAAKGGFPAMLVKRFFSGFAHPVVVAGTFGLGIAMLVLDGGRRLSPRSGVVAGVAVALIAASSLVWLYLMPRHAAFHMHMLPRHLFVTYTMLVVLVTALGWGVKTESTAPAEPGMTSVAACGYALPIAVFLALGAYTVVAFG